MESFDLKSYPLHPKCTSVLLMENIDGKDILKSCPCIVSVKLFCILGG